MDLLRQFLDVFLHVDKHLLELIRDHGLWIYAILFVIIFCETGLVVTPFLPGDSLLFAAGALSVSGAAADTDGLNVWLLVPLLIVAAIVGDAVNFAIGNAVGPGFLEKRAGQGLFRFVKPAHLQRTQDFYDRYGGKTIVLARFVPIVRTFAPFIAGIAKMPYARFATFNVVGAIAWVGICVGAGYFFGNIPIVKKNFELVILGIIGVSVLPIVFEVWRGWQAERRAARDATS
jgi:membrane-associated protein